MCTGGLARSAKQFSLAYPNTTALLRFPQGVQGLHTDDGFELMFATDIGVQHTDTCRDTPQQNPFSERVSCMLFDPARAILEEACMPLRYW